MKCLHFHFDTHAVRKVQGFFHHCLYASESLDMIVFDENQIIKSESVRVSSTEYDGFFLIFSESGRGLPGACNLDICVMFSAEHSGIIHSCRYAAHSHHHVECSPLCSGDSSQRADELHDLSAGTYTRSVIYQLFGFDTEFTEDDCRLLQSGDDSIILACYDGRTVYIWNKGSGCYISATDVLSKESVKIILFRFRVQIPLPPSGVSHCNLPDLQGTSL